MDPLPPRIVAREARKHRSIQMRDESFSEPVPYNPGGLTPAQNQFPVLEAFQEYLESERARARRRINRVTFAIAGFVLALSAVGYWLISRHIQSANERIEDVTLAMQGAEADSRRIREEQARNIEDLRNEADRLKSVYMAGSRASADSREKFSKALTQQNNAVGNLLSSVSTLEKENAAIREELADISTSGPDIAQKIDLLASKLDALLQDPNAPSQTPPPVGKQPAGTGLMQENEIISMLLLPEGAVEPARWRMAIPE